MKDSVQPYLDYLEKEMNIMGILSAFCVALAAITLERIAGADEKAKTLVELWNLGQLEIVLGSASVMLSALFFYRQRSRLAWHYGQICLAVSPYRAEIASRFDQLREVDSWATWVCYRTAFIFMMLGCGEYVFAVVRLFTKYVYAAHAITVIFWIMAILFCLLQWYVMSKYRHAHSSWCAAWHAVTGYGATEEAFS